MSSIYKEFDIPVGQEAAVSKEISDYYNRQGRIGNSVNNMKLLIKSDGGLTAVVSSEGRIDDGRQIDDIEDRKNIEIIRVAPKSGDESKVAAFTNTHNELGNTLARPFITKAGDDTIYLMIATKRAQVSDWNSDDYSSSSSSSVDRDEPAGIKPDDWMEESTPAATEVPAQAAETPAQTTEAAPAEPIVEEIVENVLQDAPVQTALPGIPTVTAAPADSADPAPAPAADEFGEIFG